MLKTKPSGLFPALFAGTLVVTLTALVPAPAAADEVPVRLRHTEGTVHLQRAERGEVERAAVNVPLYAGDRLWTEARGRAELVLDDGTFVWVDAGTTLEVIEPGADGRDRQRILALAAGSLLLAPPEEDRYRLEPLRVDTPNGSAVIGDAGLYRVDVDAEGRVWLSVYRGQAELVAGGLSEPLRAGERSFAEAGTAPARAQGFSTAEGDAFTDWQAGRLAEVRQQVTYTSRRDYVPRRIVRHAVDLEPHGSWFYHDAFGTWAWRPHLRTSFSPFRHGRWSFLHGSWVWVPHQPWAWVTVHFGRWHHLSHVGWVWFPGHVWSPAWVQWFVGPTHVAWCPINFFNRPVVNFNTFVTQVHHFRGGHGELGIDGRRQAVNQGRVVDGRGFTRGTAVPADAWTFVEAGKLGNGDVERVALERDKIAGLDLDRAKTLINGPLRLEQPGRAIRNVEAPRVATPRGVAGHAGEAPRGDPRDALDRGRAVEAPGGRALAVPRRPADDDSLRRDTPSASTEARPRPGGLGVDRARPSDTSRPRAGVSGDDGQRRESALPRPGGNGVRYPSGVRPAIPVRPRPGVPDRAVSPEAAPRPDRGSTASRPAVPERRPAVPRPPTSGDTSRSYRPPAMPGSGAAVGREAAPAARPDAWSGRSRPGGRAAPPAVSRNVTPPRQSGSGSLRPPASTGRPDVGTRSAVAPRISPAPKIPRMTRPSATPRTGRLAPRLPAVRSGSGGAPSGVVKKPSARRSGTPSKARPKPPPKPDGEDSGGR